MKNYNKYIFHKNYDNNIIHDNVYGANYFNQQQTQPKPERKFVDCEKCRQPIELVGWKRKECQNCLQLAANAVLMMAMKKERVYFTMLPRDLLLLIVEGYLLGQRKVT